MMTFRDMTFCAGDGCLKFGTCPRALTDKVRSAAARWRDGDDPLISQFAYPRDLPCYEPPTNETP